MIQVTLREHEQCPRDDLDPAVLAGVAATGAVTVSPRLGGGSVLKASSLVGAVSVGDGTLIVQPKVPVRRLLFLLTFAKQDGWRADELDLGAADDLVEALTSAFLHHVERAFASGVLQGYVTRDDALMTVRGRLRENDHIRRRLGLAVPLEVRYDDFTTDVIENRLVLGAALVLMRTTVPRRLRRRLVRVTRLLDDVVAWRPDLPLPEVRFTRLNRRYRPALALAILVLRGASLELGRTDTRAAGLLFDMNRVFEDFVEQALGGALERRGGASQGQHRRHLDVDRRHTLKPDLTWWRGTQCLAVMDAKYKLLTDGRPAPADLYQLLAYCTAYGLSDGHLVTAAPGASSTITERTTGTRLHVHGLDLSLDPEALLAGVDRLARRIERTRREGMLCHPGHLP